MTTPEGNPGIFRSLVGQIVLLVPKVRPHIEKDAKGQTSFDIALDHEEANQALDELDRELHHPRLRGFMEGILNGNMKAWYSVAFGSISIIVAAAGVELGPRHGKDIQKILDILKEHKKGKQ